MPCFSDYPDDVSTQIREERDKFEALLCGVFTVHEKYGELEQTLNHVDWKEAGIKRSWAEEWWESHKRIDKLRREREAQETKEKEIREAALAKLTNEEKQTLGLF